MKIKLIRPFLSSGRFKSIHWTFLIILEPIKQLFFHHRIHYVYTCEVIIPTTRFEKTSSSGYIVIHHVYTYCQVLCRYVRWPSLSTLSCAVLSRERERERERESKTSWPISGWNDRTSLRPQYSKVTTGGKNTRDWRCFASPGVIRT